MLLPAAGAPWHSFMMMMNPERADQGFYCRWKLYCLHKDCVCVRSESTSSGKIKGIEL